MKKTASLIIAVFAFCFATAQINSNLVMAAQPPAQLSEWGNKREVLTLILSAQGSVVGQFKLKTEIKTMDGTVIGSADLAKTPVFTGNPAGTTILFANDVMPLEYMIFTDKYKKSLQRTGKLPADNYTFCVQPVRPVDYVPVGEVKCKNFYLATTQLPILMKPYNEEVLDAKTAQTAITFRWTPVVPTQTSPVNYRIQVFEVLPTQSPVQALRSNQPLLDKEILAATQYIWQPQLSFFSDDNKKMKFIWTIQSLDKTGAPVTQTDGNGEGRSEPIIFFVDINKTNKPKKEN
jgi:hypothetical protein